MHHERSRSRSSIPWWYWCGSNVHWHGHSGREFVTLFAQVWQGYSGLLDSMDINDLHPTEDYSHRFFIWHEWIQVCPVTRSCASTDVDAQMIGRLMDHWPLRMSLTTLLPLCSMTSKAITKFCVCRQCIRDFRLLMRWRNWGERGDSQAEFDTEGLVIIDSIDDLLAWNLLLYTHNLLRCLSFINVNDYHRTKVRSSQDIVSIVLNLILKSVRPLAAYFIMKNRIYQSPDLYTVLSNRLVSVMSIFLWFTHRTPYTAYVPLFSAIVTRYLTR
jgi:mediator of RNA polymerase II transcription subunit 6